MQNALETALKAQKDLFNWQMDQVKLLESHTVQLLDLNRKTLELGIKTATNFGQVFADSVETPQD